MRNVVLVGMPGSGKTTLGRLVAEALGRAFIDLDERTEEREGRRIGEIFREHGEDYFRECETQCVREVSRLDHAVLATGGGVVLRTVNVEELRRNGYLVFIDRSSEKILECADLTCRPLLQEDRRRIHELYDQRIGRYRACADLTVKNEGSWGAVVQQIVEAVRRMERGDSGNGPTG